VRYSWLGSASEPDKGRGFERKWPGRSLSVDSILVTCAIYVILLDCKVQESCSDH
jgi:hypothetical protein